MNSSLPPNICSVTLSFSLLFVSVDALLFCVEELVLDVAVVDGDVEVVVDGVAFINVAPGMSRPVMP